MPVQKVISQAKPLHHTLRSHESKKWSPTKHTCDYYTKSPCKHLRKCIENSMENMHTDVRVSRVSKQHKFIKYCWIIPKWASKKKFLTALIWDRHTDMKIAYVVTCVMFGVITMWLNFDCRKEAHLSCMQLIMDTPRLLNFYLVRKLFLLCSSVEYCKIRTKFKFIRNPSELKQPLVWENQDS